MNTWFMSLHELKFVLTEYGKLLWFVIYSNSTAAAALSV